VKTHRSFQDSCYAIRDLKPKPPVLVVLLLTIGLNIRSIREFCDSDADCNGV
jgi:hypothetical protein